MPIPAARLHGFVDEPFRMEGQLAQLAVQPPQIIRGGRRPVDGQPQRRCRDDEVGRLDAEESLQQFVGQLVVFRSTDAVHEQIAKATCAESVVAKARVRNFMLRCE